MPVNKKYQLGFNYLPEQKVFIKPIENHGIIVGLYFYMTEGVKYLVRWYKDGNIEEHFYYDWELSNE